MPQRECLSLSVIDRINLRAFDAWAYKEYRPTTAALIVRDSDGAVLLVQPAGDAGDWGCPQGVVREGESVTVALVRELREKLLLGPQSFAIDAYLGEEDLAAGGGNGDVGGFTVGNRYFFFALICTQPDAVVIDPVELTAALWVDPRDLSSAMVTTRPEKRDMLLRHFRPLS